MSLCALCATPIDGDPECMVLVCKNGHDDSVHDKCYKNRYSNETYKKAQHSLLIPFFIPHASTSNSLPANQRTKKTEPHRLSSA